MRYSSKPVGWRNESHRHYLAAKGISTKKYFGKRIELGEPMSYDELMRHQNKLSKTNAWRENEDAAFVEKINKAAEERRNAEEEKEILNDVYLSDDEKKLARIKYLVMHDGAPYPLKEEYNEELKNLIDEMKPSPKDFNTRDEYLDAMVEFERKSNPYYQDAFEEYVRAFESETWDAAGGSGDEYYARKFSQDELVLVKDHPFRGTKNHVARITNEDIMNEDEDKYVIDLTKEGQKRMSVHIVDEDKLEKMPLEQLKDIDYFQYAVEKKHRASEE